MAGHSRSACCLGAALRAELQRVRERCVRSVKEECLNRIVPLGERHLRKTLHEFATHYYRERNHQGLANELIEPSCATTDGCRSPAPASRRDPQLLLPVSRVEFVAIQPWDRTGAIGEILELI